MNRLAALTLVGALAACPSADAPAPREDADAAVAPPSLPVAPNRAAALAALRTDDSGPGVRYLVNRWHEDPETGARDLPLAVARLARDGALTEGLALLDEAMAGEHLELARDLAIAIAENVPNPAAAKTELGARGARSAPDATLMARLEERSGRPRDALPWWQLAARLAPEDPSPVESLVRLYAVTGDPKHLRESLELLVKLDPGAAAPRTNLVRLLARDGDTAGAEAVAWAPAPDDTPALRALEAAGHLARAGLHAPALAAYDKGLAAASPMDPLRCDLSAGRARTFVALARADEAKEALYALVEKPIAGIPCAVRESATALVALGARPRLVQLARKGGGADPVALSVVLDPPEEPSGP